MSEIERLRGLWGRAAKSDDAAPDPDNDWIDLATAAVNALPALLDASDALVRLVKAWDYGTTQDSSAWSALDREITASLAQAHAALARLDGAS